MPDLSPLFVIKVLLSAIVLVIAGELAKRDTFWGAALIALPLASILAMTWLWIETRDDARVAQFGRDILLLVPVSLLFFLPFVFEARTRLGFTVNLVIGLVLLAAGVTAMRRWAG